MPDAQLVPVERERTGTAGRPDWFLTTKRTYLLDFQMPDSADQMPIGQPRNLRDIDVERIVRQLHEHGVEALYTHAKDNQGNCYYDTAVGHKHSGIGDRDLMREFSTHCRAVGMKILYYVQLTRERRANAEELYAARRQDGSPVMLRDLTPQLPSREEKPVACLNGPHRQYILNIVRELSANYDFDGYWLDCFGWWGRINPCYCDVCAATYREDTGAALPPEQDKESAAWKRYLRWRRRLNSTTLHDVQRAIKAVNPRLSVNHNGSAQNAWSDWSFCDVDDYVTHEFHYNEGHGHLSLLCRKLRALKPGVPFEVEIWRFFNRLSDTLRGYQIRPLPMHQVEMATVLAHGGFIQYYDQINPDGTLDTRSLRVMQQAFDDVRRWEPWLQHGLGAGGPRAVRRHRLVKGDRRLCAAAARAHPRDGPGRRALRADGEPHPLWRVGRPPDGARGLWRPQGNSAAERHLPLGRGGTPARGVRQRRRGSGGHVPDIAL
ncbi:MAG: GH151 [uncultured Chloroflexi bacterium]|uniref:GH151 n=1 Tax=uncultured Chloroflexota bacterium TaxID=166587 RepID=A0A6J4HVV7_9CHLR|nr:MAG: GH151 [uncultured Chloroflexota bacterium]